MKKIEELYRLIHSMSQAEKRYFKLYSKKYKQAGKSNTVQLFELLDKQKEYNEVVLKRKLKKLKVVPSLRNYLYNLILQCLTDFFSKNEKEYEVRQMIVQARILTNKMLYKQAKKILLKAKKIAYELYFSFLWVEINRDLFYNERLLLGSDRKAELPFFEDVKRGLQTELIIYETIQKYDELREITFLFDEGMIDRATFEKKEVAIIEALRAMPKTDNYVAEINKNFCYSHYYDNKRDREANLKVCLDNLTLIRKVKEEGRMVRPWIYINVLSYLVIPLYEAGRLEECQRYLEDLEACILEQTTGNEQVRFYFTYAAYASYINYQKEDYTAILELANTFKHKYLDQQKTSIVSVRYHLYMRFLFSAFVLCNYDETIFWVNQVEELPALTGHHYMEKMAQILLLWSHYELKNYQLVENLSSRFIRQLNGTSTSNLKTFLKVIFRFINQHAGIEPTGQRAIQQLYASFSVLLAEQFSQLNQEEESYKEFEALLNTWLASK